MVNTYKSRNGAYAWSFVDLIKILDEPTLPIWLQVFIQNGTLRVWRIESAWRVEVTDWGGALRVLKQDDYLVLLSGEGSGSVAVYGAEDIVGTDFEIIGSVIDVAVDMPPAMRKSDLVNHPDHYGGKDNPYEVIKVIDAWGLDFHLGNSVKYIARAGKKDPEKEIQDLEKARFYVDHKINLLKEKHG